MYGAEFGEGAEPGLVGERSLRESLEDALGTETEGCADDATGRGAERGEQRAAMMRCAVRDGGDAMKRGAASRGAEEWGGFAGGCRRTTPGEPTLRERDGTLALGSFQC